MSKDVKLLDFRDKGYFFDLDNDMLETLGREFDVHELMDEAVKAIERGKDVEKVFETYAQRLAKRSLQLGEEKTDRTYEIIKDVVAQLGESFKFPHVAQRFLEIAYLGVLPIMGLNVLENHKSRLKYRLDQCAVFDELKERCNSKVVEALPCRQLCLTLARTLFDELDISARVEMDAMMPKNGYCQFSAIRR